MRDKFGYTKEENRLLAISPTALELHNSNMKLKQEIAEERRKQQKRKELLNKLQVENKKLQSELNKIRGNR